MYTKIISQQPLQIVSLAEAKRQLNIVDSSEDDAHIQLLIDACSELAEGYTNRMLSEGTVNLVTSISTLFLPYGEVTEDESPIVVTSDGVELDYEFNQVSQILTIENKWPASPSTEKSITYSAGYKMAPNCAKLGVLMMISSMFENRENTVVGLSTNDIPLNSMAILDKIKIQGA